MFLDLRTIFITGALTCFIIGMMQFATFATGRFSRSPIWWGASSLCIGFGLLGTALRGEIPDWISIQMANTVLLAGCLLLLTGIRHFAGRKLYWLGFGCTLATIWALLALMPGVQGYPKRVAVFSLATMLCDAAIVREAARLARTEKLRSAWLVALLFAPTVVIYGVRGLLAAFDHVGTELFASDWAPVGWLAGTGVAFIILRGQALLLLAAERSNEALATLAQRDPLTGAMNRSGLEKWLARRSGGARQAGQPASILLVDIDHFKRLNDTLGHAAGDEILRLFTDAVRGQLRSGDILARQGGDEFAIVLPEIGADEAVRVAERIRSAFREAARALAPPAPTLSIGVAEVELRGRGLEALLAEADEALYRAKRLGRDRVQVRVAPTAA
ncbi:GGDEF domain-containing protein [Bosea minatitlanensis]|uniref:diguanylate cyclase n=1 Tax=Bosea minatitlanensis TaxID=128782 RepID=A0ABW0F7G1_9HYPH|nr:GGDEF domain-containing protein [Bosea minatitlanensis]MCT4493844.1 GGDEF domain-containing protein [Bosea minatitlanensis]